MSKIDKYQIIISFCISSSADSVLKAWCVRCISNMSRIDKY